MSRTARSTSTASSTRRTTPATRGERSGCYARSGEGGKMTDSEREATELLEEWMAAFNARDLPRWAATFNYPSVRLASGRLIIFESAASHRPDVFERLAGIGWGHSAWDPHRVLN